MDTYLVCFSGHGSLFCLTVYPQGEMSTEKGDGGVGRGGGVCSWTRIPAAAYPPPGHWGLTGLGETRK